MLLLLWVLPVSFSSCSVQYHYITGLEFHCGVYYFHIYILDLTSIFSPYLRLIATKFLDTSIWMLNIYHKFKLFKIKSVIFILKPPFIQAINKASVLMLSFSHLSQNRTRCWVLWAPTGSLTPCFLLPSSICNAGTLSLSSPSSLSPNLYFSRLMPTQNSRVHPKSSKPPKSDLNDSFMWS